MRHTSRRLWSRWLLGLGLVAATPRCNCDEGQGIQRAGVEMALGFVDSDSCSGAALTRRVPDDYPADGPAPSADFGSRAQRVFEVRSLGTAPLTLRSVELSAPDPEFQIRVSVPDPAGTTAPAVLPLTIVSDRSEGARPGALIEVEYSAQDAEPDLVELVVTSDDPKRTEVRFVLAAGRGQLEVCGTNGCGEDAAITFEEVPIGESATESLTLKNVGEGDLDLRAIELVSSSAEFCAPEATALPEGVPDCEPVNLCRVLRPGEEYTVRIRYSPSNGGLDTGVVRVVSGDVNRGNVEVPIQGMGAGPALCPCVVEGALCAPVSLVDFGSVDVGTSAPKTVRLVSCGTEPVDLTEAVLETAAGPFLTGQEFSITAPFETGRLEPGAASEGVIAYRPLTAGEHHGGLRYVMAQMRVRSWLTLLGRAATCDLSVLPERVAFGAVASGSSAERRVALSNNGARACSVSEISDPQNGFTLTNKPALPFSIAPGESFDLGVRYTSPARSMPRPDTSSFVVVSNEPGPGARTTVELSASGGGVAVCEVTVVPTNNSALSQRDGVLLFNAVTIGYAKTLPVRVTNVGTGDCRFERYTLETQATQQVTVTPSARVPATIAPGGSFQLDVTFRPTGPGPTLGIPPGTYGSLQNHIDFSLSGPNLAKTSWSIGIRATPTVPTIDVLPDRVDFGMVTWQNPQAPDDRSSCGSATRQVNVYNSGTGALEIFSLAIDPSSDPVFLITGVTNGGARVAPPYSMRVAPGGSASIELRFFPSRVSPAAHSGLLLIENSVTGMGSPLTVPMTGSGTPNATQTDVFTQLVDNKVDILWVVDDSGSMREEQQSLADNFQNFIGDANLNGVDYQVGVITTEVNDEPAGKLWACNGFDRIIRAGDSRAQAAFECAANVTNPPNGNTRPNPGGSDEAEAGLRAARLALDAPIRDAENAGFMRDDARLAVIIVSDEEDQSTGPANLYVDFFKNIKGYANSQLVSVSAIAGDVPNGCATAEAGARYQEAAAALGGQFESICTSSWSNMLQNLGLNVFALRTAWPLTRPADPSTISVRVNGSRVGAGATSGWTFDAPANTLELHGPAVPPPGARIEVQYGAACLR